MSQITQLDETISESLYLTKNIDQKSSYGHFMCDFDQISPKKAKLVRSYVFKKNAVLVRSDVRTFRT